MPTSKLLFLRFYEEQEFRDIGTTLGIEERTAQKRVYRTMDRLRGDLKKRGIVAPAAIFSGQLFIAGASSAPANLATSLATLALINAAKAFDSGNGVRIDSLVFCASRRRHRPHSGSRHLVPGTP